MSVPSVLVEHFEEFQVMCGLRQSALRSAEWFEGDIVELDRRIESHLDGLLSSAASSQPVLEEQLGGEDPEAVFAAALVLLKMNTESATDSVLTAFQAAPPELQTAFVEAFSLAPGDLTENRLKSLYKSGPALTASAAAEVLVRHRKLTAPVLRLDEFFRHGDPVVRRTAWRIAAQFVPQEGAGSSQGRG